MRMRRATIGAVAVFLLIALGMAVPVQAASCEQAVAELNARLPSKIDPQELVEILRTLDQTGNRQLPRKFITKRGARAKGWKPGMDLWSVNRLRGASIGGDAFMNLEGRLPKNNTWREADLDYRGGKRGGKRLVFSRDGRRFVTVDHYGTFVEIPTCQ